MLRPLYPPREIQLKKVKDKITENDEIVKNLSSFKETKNFTKINLKTCVLPAMTVNPELRASSVGLPTEQDTGWAPQSVLHALTEETNLLHNRDSEPRLFFKKKYSDFFDSKI